MALVAIVVLVLAVGGVVVVAVLAGGDGDDTAGGGTEVSFEAPITCEEMGAGCADENQTGEITGGDIESPVADTSGDSSDETTTLGTTTTTVAPPALAQPVALVQRWATALATGDIATARAIQPGLANQTDQELLDGYAGMAAATILYASGTQGDLWVASIAHEVASAQDRTSVYCFHLAVDATASSFTMIKGENAGSPVAGWVEPSAVQDQIDHCG